MSIPEPAVVASHIRDQIVNQEGDTDRGEKKPSLKTSLKNYAIAGAAAAFLLSLIELIDLNIRLTPVFEHFFERLLFSAYFSLNLVVGSTIGLLVGLFVHSASFAKRVPERIMQSKGEARPFYSLMAGLGVCAVAAFLMNQQLDAHTYVIGLIREAEKFPALKDILLPHERGFSYLTLFGLTIACSLVAIITRASANWNWYVRSSVLMAIALLIAVVYYIDSRIEVQLYEQTLHRSMFLLNFTLAMSLVGSLRLSISRMRPVLPGLRPALWKKAVLVASVLLLASAAFTLIYFDENQNLKTQVFYRTAQANQYFKFTQWALDFDRDGYSAFLGGGDANDHHSGVNPGQFEVAGDGVDNNCIGGDLTKQDIDEWKRGFNSLGAAPIVSGRRFNIIYIFIDALRADHLGTYGYPRLTSPSIDKLAARSSVFEHAYTPAPNTYEALPKFMQASYWDGHFETWTEVLARNGYDNLLFPRRIGTLLRHVKGMTVLHHARVRKLEQTVDIAIDVLGSAPASRPFCAYLYATDPHGIYRKHDEFNFGSSLTDGYDGEIAYTDHHFGRLFDWMERSGRMNDTMIVIMADHGESLGERGFYEHSTQLYDEQSRIPMIIYVPGLPPRRIPSYVSSVDLGPTILNLVGLQHPSEYLGVSLSPLMRGESFVHPPVYAEQTYIQGNAYVRPEQNVLPENKKYMVITQDGYKLIYNRNSYCFELFDLKNDPKEERNLYDYLPEKAAEMRKLVGRYIDVLNVSRPRDADETKYSLGPTPPEEDER